MLAAVSEETELPMETVLSRCGRAEVVDARWLAVYLMSRCGLYTMRIAEEMGVTPRYVQYILTDFEDRTAISRPLRNKYERTAKKLRNDLEITTL